MRRSSDAKSSLGKEAGQGGRRRRSRMGRPEGYRIDKQAQGRRQGHVQNSLGVDRNRERSLLGPSWKCRQIWRAQATGLACSCWLAMRVSLVAGKAAPASRPAPVSPFLCSPTCTTGKPRATPYSFLSNYGSGRASTSPTVSDPSSWPLISTFLAIFNPVSLRLIFSAQLTGRSARRPDAASQRPDS